MKILFSGGCKNGKSTLAERSVKALAGDGPLYYIATMIPHDDEDRARIRHHVESRAGMGFITLEQGTNVTRCLDRADENGAFLLDSVTALLSNEMWSENGYDPDAGERGNRHDACACHSKNGSNQMLLHRNVLLNLFNEKGRNELSAHFAAVQSIIEFSITDFTGKMHPADAR